MASRTSDGPAGATTESLDATRNRGTASTTAGDGIGGTVAEAAGTVRDVAGDAVSRLPEVAATTRSAIEDANRQMRAGSDEMLTVGSVLSFGFAMGLLIGGANRLLIAGALVPAAMMWLTLLDRSSNKRSVGRGL
ncbi:MAG: hypothetical protein ABI553_00220 [Chloroflexota bacterium]